MEKPVNSIYDSFGLMARDLLDSFQSQSGVLKVHDAGFLAGNRHDGIIIGSESCRDGTRLERIILEVSYLPVIDHTVTRELIRKLSSIQHEDDKYYNRMLLLYSGSVTAKARQDLENGDLIARSLRSSDDLRRNLWTTILPDYQDPGLSDRSSELVSALNTVPTGAVYSAQYEQVCTSVLEFLFRPDLGPAKPQSYTLNRSQRRDFIMKNEAQDGFWARARERYKADYLIVEVKNSSGRVANKSVWQLSGYMKEKGVGFFGMLVARGGVSKGEANLAIVDQWIHANKMIVPISNDDLLTMIQLRDNGFDPTELVEDLIDRIRCWV